MPGFRSPLPIDEVLDRVVESLQYRPNLLLRAPTGAGKTTRVPLALLQAGFAASGRIYLLEPRRLAARSAAARMADELGSPLGSEVGYKVRFESRFSPQTRILVVTPGMLLRELHSDPYLESASMVIFDEFHERGVESDLALGLARLMQQTVRGDLKLLVMSATLETEAISVYLGGAPVVAAQGRAFPVEIRYAPRADSVAELVAATIDETPGDLLVFLPGVGEIRQTAAELAGFADARNLLLLPLHGEMPLDQQSAAMRLQAKRKVVLATNVAETSVTVEGITAVIDTGLARILRFDANVGLDRLRLEPISQASAEQRAGRAGRTAPGICVRMWAEHAHAARPTALEPEVRRVDLAGPLLQILNFGEAAPQQFPWLDPPRPESVAGGLNLLRMLGAADQSGLTDEGRAIARLPVHPRIGKLLLSARGAESKAALAAAYLAERDPFERSARPDTRRRLQVFSDLAERLSALEEFEETGRLHFECGTLAVGPARFCLRSRDQLLRSIDARANPSADAEEILLRALLAAFPDRLAKRRTRGGDTGLMVGGRGVRIAPSSGVIEPELFLCLDADAGETEAIVHLASGVLREWLPGERIQIRECVDFSPGTEKVTGTRRTYFEDLLLEEVPSNRAEPEEVTRVLVAAARANLPKVLPSADSAAGMFLLRVRCLSAWMPELKLPVMDDAALGEMLTWLAAGCRSFAELRARDWLAAIKNQLGYSQVQTVEREAPERIEVPTGSSIALEYAEGRPPVLAVRIQELFGLTETPRIAGGRVPVLLHLLAPNYRPQQVTDDLASFWANTYPMVRKELRARYPKHSWPDDPLSAEPVRGAKRRGS